MIHRSGGAVVGRTRFLWGTFLRKAACGGANTRGSLCKQIPRWHSFFFCATLFPHPFKNFYRMGNKGSFSSVRSSIQSLPRPFWYHHPKRLSFLFCPRKGNDKLGFVGVSFQRTNKRNNVGGDVLDAPQRRLLELCKTIVRERNLRSHENGSNSTIFGASRTSPPTRGLCEQGAR